jgi:predicted membrane-bound spermidine synthase
LTSRRHSEGGSASPFALALLLGVFFASGFAALLYQVIWQRLLALFSGADVFSATIVVAAFMAGLGCGNVAGGHLGDRVSRSTCLALFALAEFAIALFALGSRVFYYDFLYGKLGAHAIPLPALALLLFLSVVWPTFFMGVSLPLLARGLTAAIEAAARTVGSLYGWNTLGAAVGAFVTTWFLLRRYDVETCLRIGAVINFVCAAAVLPLRRLLFERRGSLDVDPSSPSPVAPPSRRAPSLGLPGWLLLYGLSGAVALSLEIAWFRALGVMVKSTSFTFGTLLAIYLGGVASGSIVGSRAVVAATPQPALRFLSLQACIPLYAGLSIATLVLLVDRMALLEPLWRHFGGSEPLNIGLAIAGIERDPLAAVTQAGLPRLFLVLYFLLPLALIGPPTFLMGLCFPYLQKAVQTDARFLARRVGWLQTANIGGSLLGSVLTGFAFLPLLGTSGTFRLLAASGGVFLLLRARARGGGSRLGYLVAAAAVLLAVGAIPGSEILWSKLHGTLPGSIVVAEDASGVSLIRPPQPGTRGRVVMAGGLELSRMPYGASYDGVHTLLGALPILLHPRPARIAVIGLGSGDTSFAAGGRPEVAEVETIEIVGSQLTVLRAFDRLHGDPGLRLLLSDPRFRFVVADGRTHVRLDRHGYDVIEADALRPNSAYSGNLYSLEYFALLREKLNPGGLAVTWVPTPRVRDTFFRSFPYVLLLEAVAIGSESPIRLERDALLARCEEPEIRSYYRRAGINLRKLVETQLGAGKPRLIGPGVDRSVFGDLNSDLFAKDEFLVQGRSR